MTEVHEFRSSVFYSGINYSAVSDKSDENLMTCKQVGDSGGVQDKIREIPSE